MKTPDFIHGCGSIGCATIILAIIVAIIIHACGCTTVKSNAHEPVSTSEFRDAGGPYASGMKNHGTTAAKLGEAYSFWAATSFGDGHATSTIWFRKINVDATGRIVSIGPAEKSVKVCTDF